MTGRFQFRLNAAVNQVVVAGGIPISFPVPTERTASQAILAQETAL